MSRVAAILVVLAAGCSSSLSRQCIFAGDPAAALEIGYLFHVDPPPDGVTFIADAGAVPLRRPVQGGFVLYIGALLRNLDPCGVTLTAELKDPQTGNVISNLDQREADLEPALPPHADWWRPTDLSSLSTVPNIPACPDALGRGAAGRPA